MHATGIWVVDMMRHEHDDKTTPGHSSVTRNFRTKLPLKMSRELASAS